MSSVCLCGGKKASFKWSHAEKREPTLFDLAQWSKDHRRKPHNPRDTRTQQAIDTMLEPIHKQKTYQQFENEQNRINLLADETDLFNQSTVTTYILTLLKIDPTTGKRTGKPVSNGYKKCLFQTYYTFCTANQLAFDRPKIHASYPIPLIPTRQQIQNIMSQATWKYAVIFSIMAETAIEPQELTNITHNRINLERGEISVTGTKQHANGVYPLRAKTAEMLRRYLAKRNPNLPPFPPAKSIEQSWQRCRKSAIQKFADPELQKVQLKSLRNFAGAEYYYSTGNKDAFATQRFMRHHRLSTTELYLRGITIRTEDDDQYTSRTVQLGQPDSKQQIQNLLDNGFTYILTADNHTYFRKRKQLQIT